MASKYDVKFHCSKRILKSGKKSRHNILNQCDTVTKVLTNNPKYGVSIPGAGGLRKMRVSVPTLRIGKRGGYRLIYSQALIGEVLYIVFLETFFKTDNDDLSKDQYSELKNSSAQIYGDVYEYDWDDAPPIP